MKRVSAGEHPTVVGIPLVVGVAIVRVEPLTVLVAFHVEHVEVAIGISERASRHPRHHPSNTLRIESNSESPRLGNSLAQRTKYLHFLKLQRMTLAETVTAAIPHPVILEFGRPQP